MHQSLKRTLVNRIGLFILTINIAIGLLYSFTSIQLAEEKFKNESDQLSKQLADAFTLQLWLFDLNTTENLANLALKSSNIIALRLVDHKDSVILEKGDLKSSAGYPITRELVHENNTKVGSLNVVFHKDLWESQTRSLVIIGVIAILSTIIVTIVVINYILKLHLITPLEKLESDMIALSEGSFPKSRFSGYKSEIQRIVDVFNTISDSLKLKELSQKKAEQQLIASQERYYSLFTGSNDSIFTITLNGELVDANPTLIEISGYNDDELHALSFNKLLTFTGREGTFQQTLFAGMSVIDEQVQLHTKSGKIRECLLTCSSWVNETNQPLGYHCILRDITRQRQLESQLYQSRKMEAIGTLAGGIAHDFNNILAISQGYAEIIKHSIRQDSPIADDIEQIIKANQRATNLVKQILAFSRQAEIQQIPILVQSYAKEITKMLRSSMPTTINIEESLSSACGIVVMDPTQLQQILMNLCTNAQHAMEPDGGVLTIELNPKTVDHSDHHLLHHIEPGNYIELKVSDTGCGIPESICEKIFDPYFTTKEMGKGTGMGLSIIHGIITKAGGTILVDSVVDKGSVFTVYLPSEEGLKVLAHKNQSDSPRGSGHILVVDDEEQIVNMEKSILTQLGYRVTTTTNSSEALQIFSENPENFDAVVTDQTMPELTGVELAQQLLQLRFDIPILLCTGYSSVVDEKTAKDIGIAEFLFKPVTVEQLSKTIQKMTN